MRGLLWGVVLSCILGFFGVCYKGKKGTLRKIFYFMCICRGLRYSNLSEICVMSRLYHCLSEVCNGASLIRRLMLLADFCRFIAVLVNNAFKTVQQSAKDKEDICRRADARQRYLTQDFTL